MKKTIALVLVLALGMAGEVANADFIFGTPTNLGPNVNGSAAEEGPSISADGLTLYFNSNMSGGYGSFDLWMTKRATEDDPWGQPENLGPVVNSSSREHMPSISSDELRLYFSSNRSGSWDIWVATRVTKDDPWGSPVKLGFPVGPGFGPGVSADGLSLYFGSSRAGGYGSDDIWVSTRITTDDPWSGPENLGLTVNGSTMELCPKVSTNHLVLFFSDGANAPFRPDGYGNGDLWMTTRASDSDPWGTPVNLGPTVNSPAFDGAPNISADGSVLYFMSGRSGGYGPWDLWQVPILPVVDFNGDGIVDSADICMMVDHWHTDYPLCDIAPVPFGDGIVDVQDLTLLAEYLFQDVNDPTLMAHWALDETEGGTALDSVGENNGYSDGYVFGDPLWQPDGGQVNGALQLDGVDDYVVTGFPRPEKKALSVLAWIKGGAPGQVILAQIGKANWLSIDPSEGTLMTELAASARNSSSLGSEAIITDDTWHRIGFVWDGSYRRLYVDGIIVAEDVQDTLDISGNGLYFGTGKAIGSGTFWSGLIDDIRIYNRAVSP